MTHSFCVNKLLVSVKKVSSRLKHFKVSESEKRKGIFYHNNNKDFILVSIPSLTVS